MACRVSRRRAVARGLVLLAGLSLSAAFAAPHVEAQTLDPLPDVPFSGSTPPPPSVVEGDTGPESASRAPEDEAEEPTDAPVPEAAPAGPWGIPPVKLMIPAIGVEAMVEAVAEDPDGAMSVPTFPDDVAWYKLGPGMGVPGNVVFAGHINWDNQVRAFGLLDRLDEGDVIQVIDEQGRGFEYKVEMMHWVRAEGAPLAEIFAQPDYPQVTLITCGGEYVASRREYLDRLIVKARGA
jgi:sortase (surface protein transpeptidase)